jgi:hypothetical protein
LVTLTILLPLSFLLFETRLNLSHSNPYRLVRDSYANCPSSPSFLPSLNSVSQSEEVAQRDGTWHDIMHVCQTPGNEDGHRKNNGGRVQQTLWH